jgi:hypothetical protein
MDRFKGSGCIFSTPFFENKDKILEELMKYYLNNVNHIDKFKKLKYPPNKMLIVGSGIMALLGLKKNEDIDIWVTDDVFKKMAKDKYLKPVQKHGRLFYETHDGVIEISNIFPCTKGNISKYLQNATVVNGIHFFSPTDLIEWKKCMGRPKDLKDIKTLERYIMKNPISELLDYLSVSS